MKSKDSAHNSQPIEAMGIDAELAVEMYRTMARIRAFEEATEALFLRGEIPGFVHLSIGQEAVATGVCMALREGDYITSTHRGHGHAIAKGADPSRMMAELFGRVEGICRGRGGSMHIADFSVGMLGANGVVSGGMGIGVGAALSQLIVGSSKVTVSFFGDGGICRGLFHESLNLASIWKLPVVFVCENNGWASTTRSTEALAVADIAAGASAYAMLGIPIDGNDAFSVYQTVRSCVGRARDGGGLLCWRHAPIVSKDIMLEIPVPTDQETKSTHGSKRDPLIRAATRLRQEGVLDESARLQIQNDAEAEMSAAVDFAREAEFHRVKEDNPN